MVNGIVRYFILSFFIVVVIFVAIFVTPWSNINWGKIEFLPGSTITISGQADKEERSQIARFSVGVMANGDTKEAVTNEVNEKVTKIIQAVKNFGIPDEDIKTENISVYESPQVEILIYPPVPRESAPWAANNTISVILRDVDRASALADLLNASEANQVNGPTFSLDDTSQAEAELLKEAIEDARKKAEIIAEASGRRLGKIITVTEGGSAMPILYRGLEAAVDSGGVVPTPVEPGTETVYKAVTVVFELR